LVEMNRLLVEGWKFENARTNVAFPEAKKIAEAFLKRADVQDGQKNIPSELEFVTTEAERLKRKKIELPGLALMHPFQLPDNSLDYAKPPLPAGQIPYAREDMMDQMVNLYDLKQ